MIKSLKDLLDKFSRFTNSLVYDGGICKRLYRKTNKINSPEDLKNIKGFGDSIVSNIKKESGTAKEEVSKKENLPPKK